MWSITKISAKNICAFEDLALDIKQHEATLIFGDNMDNDSQNSNGSGKSALIEAIAIGLTGDPLRKVNMDEIINDRFDNAMISISMANQHLGYSLTINRRLSRKQPQQIQIIKQSGPYDTDTEEIVLSSVADYNKFILEQIGLSKDDILANFILTARKYKSFLSSSDKDKKEIINRFSNGVIVDESIESLRNDIEPVEVAYSNAEKELSRCVGSIEAMEQEIEKAINESSERAKNRQERIEEWKRSISKCRADIRSYNAELDALSVALDINSEIDSEMQDLEKSDTDTAQAHKAIQARFSQLHYPAIEDYSLKIKQAENALKNDKERLSKLTAELAETSNKLKALQIEMENAIKEGHDSASKLDEESRAVKQAMVELGNKLKELEKQGSELKNKRNDIDGQISQLEKQLAGVIQCPKCNHEFTLKDDIDIESARVKLQKLHTSLSAVNKSVAQNITDYDASMDAGRKQRARLNEIADEREQARTIYREIKSRHEDTKSQLDSIERKLRMCKESVLNLNDSATKLRKKMFDDVFDIIDEENRKIDRECSKYEGLINTSEGTIKSYTESIKIAEESSDDGLIESLRNSKDKYEKDLQIAIKEKESVEAKLNSLKEQEATFVEFKTYLANTKINAISQITNDFLNAIGSDIRIALSGYTILKSGKVRDKIAVSVIRDGVDCGSFEKFSAGERVRLELASILAMRQLMNVNADEGKGLDLLICDEILDSSDETGLTNIFKALNTIGVTSLVVSHGSVAENYPNRLVVHKYNGVSFIDECKINT